MSLTITAKAKSCVPDPRKVNWIVNGPSPAVPNGDFTIIPNAGAIPFTVIGDGQDETTQWTFDFGCDPKFNSFKPTKKLTSALLTLVARPCNGSCSNDTVAIRGLKDIGFFDQTVSPPPTNTLFSDLLKRALFDNDFAMFGVVPGATGSQITPPFSIELLKKGKTGFYTSAEIMGAYLGNNAKPDGLIPMEFSDDSILISAKLSLTQA